MDHLKKRALLEGQLGRMMRNMSFPGMMTLSSGGWSGAMDVYETDDALILCMDVAGVDPARLSIVAEEQKITIIGERGYPVPAGVRYVHRLEIEQGYFEKSVTLPRPIDVSSTTSIHQHGFLVITMPKLKTRGKVQITVG